MPLLVCFSKHYYNINEYCFVAVTETRSLELSILFKEYLKYEQSAQYNTALKLIEYPHSFLSLQDYSTDFCEHIKYCRLKMENWFSLCKSENFHFFWKEDLFFN